VLYAAEWPCCHDPLRLGLCFEDLSTHARAARRRQPSSHARHVRRAAAMPSCCARRWLPLYFFLLHQSPTGRRRETCTSHSSRARAQDAAAPHLHPVEECACRPVAPFSLSSTGKLFVLTGHSATLCLKERPSLAGKMQVRRESFMRLDCFKYFSLALK